MNRNKRRWWIGMMLLCAVGAQAQELHFSQYYNEPMFVSPANTGLMPSHDYRIGANYRNQWSSVPVPYHTVAAYGDFQLLRSQERNNWLGLGAAFYNDKAGDGNLALTKFTAYIAYHLSLGEQAMISAGLSAGSVQRSVDFSKLTFNAQWDGYTFNPANNNQETPGMTRFGYTDIGAGLSFAYFPAENLYAQLGVGLTHINTPKESFFGGENQLEMRPTANLDISFQASNNFIVNPSAYYTTQSAASELMYGCLFQVLLTGQDRRPTQLLLGAYHRWADALIPAVGMELGNFRIMATYDYTLSSLKTANQGAGGFEIGLRMQGLYPNSENDSYNRKRNLYNCPRF